MNYLQLLKENESNIEKYKEVVFEIIEDIALEDLEDVLIHINMTYRKFYNNTKTLDNYYSKIRVKIRDKHGYDSEHHTMSKILLKITYLDKKDI